LFGLRSFLLLFDSFRIVKGFLISISLRSLIEGSSSFGDNSFFSSSSSSSSRIKFVLRGFSGLLYFPVSFER
jgi:hypothetical protein